MLSYFFSRFFGALIVIFGVTCLVFFLIHLVPGDPVEIMLGESARPADREALRQALGLHLPIYIQFVDYLSGLVQFDFGLSIHSQRPISDILLERIPATAQLAGASLLIALFIAFPLGIMAAMNKDTVWDQLAMGISLFGVAIPNFWMGPLLILIFSLGLGWFPVSGQSGVSSIILPAFTLGTSMAAILARMIRSSLLEVLNEDYIRTAKAKGLSDKEVVLHHALKNAMLPILTLIGLQLGTLLGGAVITEKIFSWPGLGQLMIDSIQRRDYPVVQACILFVSTVYVLVNLMTDLLYARIDPRIRLNPHD